jgi:hypothetical protein
MRTLEELEELAIHPEKLSHVERFKAIFETIYHNIENTAKRIDELEYRLKKLEDKANPKGLNKG